MRAAFSNALYYPSIDIANVGWLRTVVLFWDSISTIVPESVNHPYNHYDTEYLADEDFLKPIRVNSENKAVVGIEDEAMALFNTTEGFNYVLSSKIRQRHRMKRGAMHKNIQSSVNELSEMGIYPEKLSYRLRQHLGEPFEVFGHIFGRSDYYYFEEEFAHMYMVLLANRICENNSIAPITDNMISYDISDSIRLKSPTPLSSEPSRWKPLNFCKHNCYPRNLGQGLLLSLVIDDLRISPETNLVDIIAFKKKHKDELGIFRTQLSKLTQNVSQNVPLNAMRQEISDIYTNEFLPAYNAFRDALNMSRIKYYSDNFLKVSTLSLGTTSIPMIALGLEVPYALLAGAGVSVFASNVSYSVKRRKTLKESPYSFLLSIERDL